MKERLHDHIVVGVDGSTSRLAIDWAADEAALRSIGVLLVHVTKRRLTRSVGHDLAAEEKGHQLLERASRMARAARTTDLCVRSTLVEGEPVEVLARLADDALALVVGSHDHRAVARVILGSVSQGCVERSTRPVCIVSPRCSRSGDGRIVVWVDETAASARALEWAESEAALRHAELDIVRGDDHRLVTTSDAPPMAVLADAERSNRHLDDAMVVSTVTSGDEPPRVVETGLSGNSPDHALLQVAAGADLLVVGAARRRSHDVISAVGRYCVRQAACPVIVVPWRE